MDIVFCLNNSVEPDHAAFYLDLHYLPMYAFTVHFTVQDNSLFPTVLLLVYTPLE